MPDIKYESDIIVNGKVAVVGGLATGFLKANGDIDSSSYVKGVSSQLFTYTSGLKTFTVPIANVLIISVLLNKVPLYLTNEYTVAASVVTVSRNLSANDEIYITYLIR